MSKNLSCIVLAGGQSKRMGKDKAFLSYKGKTFLRNILEKLDKFCNQIIIVGNKDPELYLNEANSINAEINFTKDKYPYAGPLNGLLSVSDLIKNEVVYVTPCDTPLLNGEIIPFLVESLDNYDAVVPQVNGKYQPLNAVYTKNALKKVKDIYEKENVRSLMGFLKRINTKILDENDIKKIDKDLLTYFSVNTPEAYQQLKNL